MLDANIAKDVIDHALFKGADFCDLFVEKSKKQNISLADSEIDQFKTGIEFGVGIRLIYDKNVYYGYSNSTDKDMLLNVVSNLALNQKSKNQNVVFHPIINPMDHKAQLPIDFTKRNEEKVEVLKLLDKKSRNLSPLVIQVRNNIISWNQSIEVFNSHGLQAIDERHYCRLVSSVVAKDGDRQESSFYGPGAFAGDEHVLNIDTDFVAKKCVDQALVMLKASPCPAGSMPVILANGFGGVIFHEACGHLLETTSVEKKASTFHDKMGEMIAHESLSAVDDGTVPSMWGSINIDDEGMKTQKTQLIENGKLVNFLSDYVGELKTGHQRTGSARRQSYKYPPASRMRNTYIAPGKDKFEDMITSIDNGLYAASLGGGSVNPGTGEFNFAVNEAYIIKDGKISNPVKGATLIGTGVDIMKKISMISDNLEMSAGMCGSVSGSVPVTVGQPTLKVDNILVGGNA